MEFTVKERLLLQQMLPKQGKDFITLTLAKNLADKIAFTSEEVEAINLHTEKDADGKVTGLNWDEQKATVKDIPFGPKTVVIVKDVLLAMEQSTPPTLAVDHLTLYQKFVGGEVKDE